VKDALLQLPSPSPRLCTSLLRRTIIGQRPHRDPSLSTPLALWYLAAAGGV
jgi:hypothetical protein